MLLDVDGVLAPIVQHPDDAHMPERHAAAADRGGPPLRRRGLRVRAPGVRCAADRLARLDRYFGSHGREVLIPGAIAPEVDRELQAWTRRVQNFADEAFDEPLRKLRVRLEDKEAIAALHWRGVPDEEEAQAAVEEVAAAAEKAGFTAHWGRKVLEIRPPVRIDKGAGIVTLLRDRNLAAALYVGDDTTDLDAFRGLGELGSSPAAWAARCASACGRTRARRRWPGRPTSWSTGPDGVRVLLQALLD